MTPSQKATNGATLAGTKQFSRIQADFEMSDASIIWDQAEKGFLTDAERIAKNMDIGGKGHLSRQESVLLGSQYQSLKEDNKQIKKQLYGLAILCVLLFIGTIAGTVMAVKNSKDTIVDMKSGVMKVNGGTDGIDIVTVKAQGTTFQTDGSVMMNEETTTDGATFTKLVVGHCVSIEDIASMWLANEKGTDARLVIAAEVNNDGTDGIDTDTRISSIEPVTSGRASWNQDHIVMGGMTFFPNEECTSGNRRRKLLETDILPFDSVSIHRSLEQRVDLLSGRRLNWDILDKTPSSYAVAIIDDPPPSPPKVVLRSAGNYVILAKAGITNVPSSKITGNIAVSPIAATAMTGFGLIKDSTTRFSTSTEVTGKVYASDYTGGSVLVIAANDMLTAYNDAAKRPSSGGAYINLGGGEIGGLVLGRGVYTFTKGISITSDIKFSGTSSDIFIMKTTGGITQAASTRVVLEGGALAENIFWQVAGVVSVGAGSHLKGILLAATSAVFITGSSLEGRILAQTAVALQMATITQPTDDQTDQIVTPSSAPSDSLEPSGAPI